MRAAFIMIAAALALNATSASAEEVSDRDAFQLWTACTPVALEVGDISESGRKLGLRRVHIETAVRSRLRAARLYEDLNAAPVLIVLVRMFKGVFAVDVKLFKAVEDGSAWSSMPDGIDQLFGFAVTWENGNIGFSDNADFVLATVERHADQFIDEYLRVNADAC